MSGKNTPLSTAARIINKVMRHTVRPVIFPRNPTPRRLQFAQWRANQVIKLVPTPKGATFTPVSFAQFDGEWVESRKGVVAGRAILYFHGGAYMSLSPRSHRGLTAALSREAKARVLAIDYRQAPQHAFPAWLEDAMTAYEHLLNEGYKPGNILLAGDSAGGNLTLSTLLKIRDDGLPMPAGAICISPWADLSGSSASLRYNSELDVMLDADAISALGRYHSQGQNPRNPLISPAFGNFRGLPPLLVHVGSTEILLDDARRVADAAKRADVPVEFRIFPNLPHVFHAFVAYLPEARDAIAEIGTFAERCFRK